MKSTTKTIAVLSAVMFLLTVTVGAASAFPFILNKSADMRSKEVAATSSSSKTIDSSTDPTLVQFKDSKGKESYRYKRED